MKTNSDIDLPKLYSRRSDGKIQTWKIIVKGNQFYTISGGMDAAKVTSERTTCAGKNEGRKNATTPEQQARREAEALHKKKIAEGYKFDINKIDEQLFFSPMLAHKYEDHRNLIKEKLSYGLIFAQCKLDGCRAIVSRAGMFSRNGKPILSAPHVFKSLQPLFTADPDLVFDGELYADKFAQDFNRIISLAKRSKPTTEDLAESASNLEYHIYDLPCGRTLSGKNAPFDERYRVLTTLLSTIKNTSIRLVQTVQCSDESQLDKLYSDWLAAGYEGQMIRLSDSSYEQKRSKNLLKRKEFQSAEFTILDVIEGTGNRSGMAGYMTFKTNKGREFSAAIKGNVAYFRKLLSQKGEVIGKEATVKFFNWTPEGSPRFPVIVALRDYE